MPTAVFQAVANLLDNAVKYSGESREFSVRLAAGKGHVTFEVDDRGGGIRLPNNRKSSSASIACQTAAEKAATDWACSWCGTSWTRMAAASRWTAKPGRGSRFRLVFPVEHDAGQ